jgi:hypothetical protein
MTERVALTWRRREPPLAPRGLYARGAAAERLVRRLLAADDATLARLEGVAGADLVCVRGAAAELPWVDGVEYLGVDAHAPGLLLPTRLVPDAPVELVRRALAARCPTPLALVPGLVVPLATARPLERAALAAWLAARAPAGAPP